MTERGKVWEYSALTRTTKKNKYYESIGNCKRLAPGLDRQERN